MVVEPPFWLNQPLIHAEKSRDVSGSIARYSAQVTLAMS